MYSKYRLDKYFQRNSVAKSIFLRRTEAHEYLCTSVLTWTKYTKKCTEDAEL